MSRYIDADHLIKRAKNPYGDSWASTGESTSDFVDYINEEPTAEVKPIVYGNWVPIDDEPHEDFECDRCGYIICGEEFATNFCPMCGADMRKEKTE